MLASIKEKYWNEEKECFTSGPIGSEAYEKGWWETTGAEMVLWPRFGIATETDTRHRRFAGKTKKAGPKAGGFRTGNKRRTAERTRKAGTQEL